ncbi:AraC family transcriptional regulator [Shewanella amazonensis]|uniref:Transcriptional regulator, AraC family n=1 Tax=Shewanella amazonensis (strain ATCC BAA-1098 / SB2B) TaxID=326297 RepID=A1S958_SHEAM|nr:AraC family transcriptional regulator [Shewanella amazonensis]ABM00915.1 transcriptional regulator, AraC family [Shewanella amazonensis SB2B]
MLKKEPVDSLCVALASAVAHHTEGEEWASTAIEGLEFYRQPAPTSCAICVVEPSIALVVQGAKSMTLGEQSYRYDTRRFLITSLDLPAKMQVLEASEEQPYLGIVLKLDLAMMSELILQAPPHPHKDPTSEYAMVLGNTTPSLLDAVQRLVALLDEPESIAVLAPLIKQEIFWRVLISEQGSRLRQIASVGSQGLRIAKSIEWLKSHYDQHLSVDGLADLARMSKSTFHHHFRALTSMSPLQYQKRLRLLEARRLMLGENMDASAAAYRVGYESPSQFSREYARLFGNPPKRDVTAHWQ